MRQRGGGGGGGAAAQPRAAQGEGGAAVDAMLARDEPLDEQEQLQVIRDLESMQASQARWFRAVFGAGAAGGAAFFGYAARAQAARPWEVRYTGELRTVVSGGGVVAALLAQSAALAAAAAALLLRLPPRPGTAAAAGPAPPPPDGGAPARRALAAAALAAAGAAAYWGGALARSLRRYGPDHGAHWDLIWLPLAPLAYVLLCWYVIRSVAGTRAEIDKLRRMTYSFKSV
ncbi:MAG: hypothetical protein J3K34DRAFT_516954 [Monoraphidium minutum]|nr:MAG: hypothetical protein J3K34DRAFT_516954 [Monoraphidium minutum]